MSRTGRGAARTAALLGVSPGAAVAAFLVALLLSALAAGCGGTDPGGTPPAQAPPDPPTPGAIRSGDVMEHLRALQRIADQSGGTRAAGTDGDRRTAEYIAERLREAGWDVRFQTVRFPFFDVRRRPVVGDLRRGRDFRVLQYSGSAASRLRVRPFDTLGCRAAELGRLGRGDLALVRRGTCTFATKVRAAQRAGAGAVAVVDRDARTAFSGTIGAPGIARIPALALTGAAAQRLVRAGSARVDVATVSERRPTRNVLAETPGTAEGRRVVMAGGHLDSVREGPGLNDNGSGIAALLEVAERLARRRGLRLAFWAAEEDGLYGSRLYVRRLPAAQRRRIAAYINLDMVGSPRPRPVVYDGDDRIERLLRRGYAGREGETDLGGASDHAPFDRAGVPVGGLFTGASERVGRRAADPCYHRACDTLRNVDERMTAAMARAARFALERLRR